MEKKLSKGDLVSILIRSNFLLGSFNFERMQAIGFCVSLIPALKKLYKDDPEEYKRSLKRHLEFFNTQPFLATPIMGIIAAIFTIVTVNFEAFSVKNFSVLNVLSLNLSLILSN